MRTDPFFTSPYPEMRKSDPRFNRRSIFAYSLFGGCLLKSMGAGKGNLNDATPDEWSTTIARIQAAYPAVQTVVPGHGEPGGPELLGFTKEMFEEEGE